MPGLVPGIHEFSHRLVEREWLWIRWSPRSC
jgi:hypothetical protein